MDRVCRVSLEKKSFLSVLKYRGRQGIYLMSSTNEHDQYDQLIEKVTRRPMRQTIGHPIFVALIAFTLFAKHYLHHEYAGIPLLILLFLYPYYLVQLLMQRRMRTHGAFARRAGVTPRYIPSSPRWWSATYIGFFFAIAAIVVGVEMLLAT